MNGYELSRNWFDWAWENPDFRTTNMAALYMWFIEKWNRCGQPQKFSVTASESMDCLGMKSRNTYSQTFNKLVEHGFIKVVVKSKNQYNCNVIMLTQKISKHKDSTRTALDQALIWHMSKHEDSIDTINKQINKETNKQINKEQKGYQLSVDFWLKEFHIGWSFSGMQGKSLKSILSKIDGILKNAERTENDTSNFFKVICLNLPDWFKDKDLNVIDSKFNEIVTEIKNKNNGISKTEQSIFRKQY